MRRDKKVECHFIIARFAFTLVFSTWPSFCPLTSVNTEECVFNTESVLPGTENSISVGVAEVLPQSQCVAVSDHFPEFF